jgi:phage shock protein A
MIDDYDLMDPAEYELITLLDNLSRLEREEAKLLADFHRLADQAEDCEGETEKADLQERARAAYEAAYTTELTTSNCPLRHIFSASSTSTTRMAAFLAAAWSDPRCSSFWRGWRPVGSISL